MPIRNIIYDIDNCLADQSNEDFRQTWCPLFAEEFGIPLEEAFRLNDEFFITDGCSARGFARHYKVSNGTQWVEDKYRTVAPLSSARFVQRHLPTTHLPALAGRLAARGIRQLVLTQGHHLHADAVLEHLGLAAHIREDDRFDRIRTHAASKRTEAPYRQVLAETGINPAHTAMVEDSAPNLAPAARLGLHTVLVGPKALDNRDTFVHQRFATVEDYLATVLVGLPQTA